MNFDSSAFIDEENPGSLSEYQKIMQTENGTIQTSYNYSTNGLINGCWMMNEECAHQNVTNCDNWFWNQQNSIKCILKLIVNSIHQLIAFMEIEMLFNRIIGPIIESRSICWLIYNWLCV